MTKFWKHFVAVVTFILLLQANSFAQVPAGSGPPGPPAGGTPPCWPPPCVPIDGGLTALLVAGAAFGGKKIYDLTREDKIES